jgi:hypothetical protein
MHDGALRRLANRGTIVHSDTMTQPTLLDSTLEMLKACSLQDKQVAAGAGVSRRWLVKLKYRRGRSPSLLHVQRLHDYLKTVTKRGRRA